MKGVVEKASPTEARKRYYQTSQHILPNSFHRDSYRRAAENALGLASENTGGYASSYAAGAAKQAGSYYGAKQAEIIPKLYRLAYEVYQDDIENDFKLLTVRVSVLPETLK